MGDGAKLTISVGADGNAAVTLDGPLSEDQLGAIVQELDIAVLRLRFNSIEADGLQVVERRRLFRSGLFRSSAAG